MNKRAAEGKRLAVLWIIIGLLLVVCIVRAVILVRQKGEEYNRKALALSAGNGTAVKAKPGEILDRNGAYLACTKRVYRLILDPKVMTETEKSFKGTAKKTVGLLTEIFGLDRNELAQCITDNADSAYVRFMGDEVLSEEEYAAWTDAVNAFNDERTKYNKEHPDSKMTEKIAGVWFEEEFRRYYPEKELLSKVIGFATKDVSEGITGLELYYNDVLRGTDGKEVSYIGADGNVEKEIREAEDGGTLLTSLDRNVAEYCQEAIKRFMQNTGAKRVNVLVMDPMTGEIIAMESDTGFDLNDPLNITGLFTEEELQDPAETFLLQEAFKSEKQQETLNSMTTEEQLTALLQQVQLNYPVSGTYEPGSTAKTLTVATGIEEHVITADTAFNCTGEIQVDRYTIHCHMNDPCGMLTPMAAMARSCNVCLVQIGERIGTNTFTKYQEIFNLGQKTGIDLPGEANTSGLIYYADNMNETELATCSFGQGFNVTMVQLASAYASILNGGYYYEPHVVTGILDDQGNLLQEIEPVLVRRTISEETSEYMKEALLYVVEKGTAQTAGEEGYLLGGKTGAAEKLPRGTGKYIVSFIGAAPIDDPRFLLYVVVDEPDVEDQSLSMPAQELAHDIFSSLYRYYNIYPESDPDAYNYDWSGLQDYSGVSDSANGIPYVEEIDGSVSGYEAAPPSETPLSED